MAIQTPTLLPIFALHIILTFLPLYSHGDYVLYTGEVLMAGQHLVNGQYRLSMQYNCELVIYKGNSPTWKAETKGTVKGHDCYLMLTNTGDLVLRKGIHYTLWSTNNTAKRGKYALVLDGKTGKIAVFGQRRWSSNNQRDKVMISESTVSTNYVLFSGQRLTAEMMLKYNEYELSLSKCNLALKNTRSGKVLWQTNTGLESDENNNNDNDNSDNNNYNNNSTYNKNHECSVQVESDGELMVMKGNQRIWSTNNRYGNGAFIAVLRFDGKFTVYGPLLWESSDQTSDKDDDGDDNDDED